MSKVVYITGGTKGIGFGIAEVLLKNGHKVAISGRKQEDVDKAVSELKVISESVFGVSSDVRILKMKNWQFKRLFRISEEWML
jgi:NAD(P)-dependent dehydrogenase (short-subunit alcohol dehydrogenase family)